jgi:phasin
MASGPRKTVRPAKAASASVTDESLTGGVQAAAVEAVEQPAEAALAVPEALQEASLEAARAIEDAAQVAPEQADAVEQQIEQAAAPVVAAATKVEEQAKEAAGAVGDSILSASKSLQAFSAKALDAYRANTAASLDYVQALANVRSVSEAIALQSEHLRKQYETLTAQAKELSALAQQVATDAAAPLKEQFGKSFKAS